MQKDPYAGHTLAEGLRIWALETGQTLHSVTLLLQHLRMHSHPELPADARTLLKPPPEATPNERDKVPITRGELWYQDVKRCLQVYFSNILQRIEVNFRSAIFAAVVTEMNELQTSGIEMWGKVHWVSLRAIIADTPARLFIK
uniref:Uncharacterized protein n=1 Tax=Anopheles epiroticus TaxID=199890 RepID=A0A182PX87_9DIPT